MADHDIDPDSLGDDNTAPRDHDAGAIGDLLHDLDPDGIASPPGYAPDAAAMRDLLHDLDPDGIASPPGYAPDAAAMRDLLHDLDPDGIASPPGYAPDAAAMRDLLHDLDPDGIASPPGYAPDAAAMRDLLHDLDPDGIASPPGYAPDAAAMRDLLHDLDPDGIASPPGYAPDAAAMRDLLHDLDPDGIASPLDQEPARTGYSAPVPPSATGNDKSDGAVRPPVGPPGSEADEIAEPRDVQPLKANRGNSVIGQAIPTDYKQASGSDEAFGGKFLSAFELDARFQGAVQAAHAAPQHDWQTANSYWQDAAEFLNGFNADDILYRIFQLSVGDLLAIEMGAKLNPRVGSNAQVALVVHEVVSSIDPDAYRIPVFPNNFGDKLGGVGAMAVGLAAGVLAAKLAAPLLIGYWRQIVITSGMAKIAAETEQEDAQLAEMNLSAAVSRLMNLAGGRVLVTYQTVAPAADRELYLTTEEGSQYAEAVAQGRNLYMLRIPDRLFQLLQDRHLIEVRQGAMGSQVGDDIRIAAGAMQFLSKHFKQIPLK